MNYNIFFIKKQLKKLPLFGSFQLFFCLYFAKFQGFVDSVKFSMKYLMKD